MFLRMLGFVFLVILVLAGWGYANSLADPVLRRITVKMQDWPEGTAPLRVALLSDLHMQGPDMPPERMARIVEQVNAQHPDLILIAGDITGDRGLSTRQYPDAELAAPLARLLAPLGVYAVLGNHDYSRDATKLEAALTAAGVRVLDDEAVKVGVLTLVGMGDGLTGHGNLKHVIDLGKRAKGPAILLVHGPEVAPRLPRTLSVVMGGHTHCGQIMFPGRDQLGLPGNGRFPCGAYVDRGRAVIVTGGLGTSILPLRFGAPPDWWMITLGGR
ncbi:metallophosphoesterase [Sphingomonas sp. AOB5]|uniref:metallophosphoesterase n=1 Tax=Sphingomonas sp. AOB5 TaxID=3034017 RepID=UPI0023F7BB5B|nr:metallophosphoesterase [Sphingomonas sp. AOB5]MDF7776858.1 metallophosphoesterase [Sphingomonas sp. AOB5]